jgi:transcriptional regulator with XRE-family HTH domain
MTSTIPVQLLITGEALRRSREGCGLPLDDAAAILGCDRSKISRIETGQRGIRAEELHALLDAYGVDAATRDALTAITGSRTAKGWWSNYRDVLTAAQREYLQIEAAASAVDLYEATQVPALLQTPEYAVALAKLGPPEESDRARSIKALQARQNGFGDGARPLTVVIAEAALLQVVGGRAVMRAQFAHLADLAGSGRVDIYVLPFRAQGRPAPGLGSMSILHVGQAPGITVVYLANASGGHFLTSPEATGPHSAAFQQLRACAHPADRSTALLSKLGAA